MKALLAVLFVMFSFNEGMAQAVGKWAVVQESQENVYTRYEFEQLQQKYPIIFDRYDSSVVASASILLRKFRYVGPTICHHGDPRLTVHLQSHRVCYLPQVGGGCGGFNARLPHPSDPCF